MNNTTNTVNTRPLMVSIRCITYNHEPYIRQCLDGFVMQKTNFRFEAIVHDDASTDGTAAIIREYAEKYPDIIKPIFETENQYSKRDGSLDRIMDAACTGKYIAFCEGDDYWTDPLKLQKQVDILEKAPQYGLVYSLASNFDQIRGEFLKDNWGKQIDQENCYWGSWVPTLTACIPSHVYLKYRQDVVQDGSWMCGDFPLWNYCVHEHRVYMMPEVTGVYRILHNSASVRTHFDKLELFTFGIYKCALFFMKRYNQSFLQKRLTQNLFNSFYIKSIRFNRRPTIPVWKYLNHYHAWNFSIALKYVLIVHVFGRQLIRFYLKYKKIHIA